MDTIHYAERSRLPLKVLNWMVAKKIIQNPLTDENLIGLRLLEKVWWKKEIIRAQLIKFSKGDQRRLLETADIKTKWERYAFSRYLNLPPGEKLSMKKLIDEIELTFNFPLEGFHRRRLYKVREKAYNWRKRLVNRTNK